MKTRDLSMGEKQAILKLRKEEKSIRAIAQELGIANTTIWNVLKKKETTCVLTTGHGTGRPRKTTADDRNIVRAVKKNQKTTVRDITNNLHRAGVKWELVQQIVNGSLLYCYAVCNVEAREQDNWLRTTFIQRHPTARQVFVKIHFLVRDCSSFNADSLACKETFKLYISEADADIGTSFHRGLFRKVATIAPDETSVGDMRINIETKVLENLSRKGFYLAFQDSGACVAIYSVRVYYKTCPATVKSLAAFPETVTMAGGENHTPREVTEAFVENGESEDQPRIYCIG
ncbi:hypothetical protein PGIGA_G00071680 [Pangasianodon gigas]|uniref:Uncharacterized protein n=1 Tax=Pangasianodon gigas TaxID=30993 RepID=A0ACC5X7J0_PANGG|nr:hypothetical protein [Pangasianodon gigas]